MPRVASRSWRPNLIVGMILAMTAGILYTNFDPVPVGESPARASDREFPDIAEIIVPTPPEAAGLPVVESAPHDSDAVDTMVETAPSTLSNNELIEYSMFLLRDGVDYLKQFPTYTAMFHKQERLGGDLSDVQNIEFKIRQSPTFAVYMKWRNGHRGRQLLYSDEYEDGNMVVKLGGFKGRLLPGLRLNPNGSKARSEARHSVTQSGIMAMAEQMIAHRRRDLAAGHGIRCTRLPNQEFNDRACCGFLFEYESPRVSQEYRKSLALLDAEHHFPVLARNYTWAAESTDLSEQELDALTLIENYSYTGIDFSKTLTALDFSRENRRYRM